MLRIRQIYFSPVHLGTLDPLWHPYKNEGLTPIFENEVFRKLYLEGDYKDWDYYGIFSHKFFNKHRKDGKWLERAIERDKGHDVYSFFLNKQSDKPNSFYDTYHPHLMELGLEVVYRLFNEDLLKIKADRIYYNHWLAKEEVFEGYCKEMLLPTLELLEGPLKSLVWRDAQYHEGLTMFQEVADVMSKERCMEVFGTPFYPHHPFLLERLPAIYFALKGLSVKQL